MPALTPLSAPTERPDEDVTAYTPQPAEPQVDRTAVLIRSLYAARPTPKLRALLNQIEAEGR